MKNKKYEHSLNNDALNYVNSALEDALNNVVEEYYKTNPEDNINMEVIISFLMFGIQLAKNTGIGDKDLVSIIKQLIKELNKEPLFTASFIEDEEDDENLDKNNLN